MSKKELTPAQLYGAATQNIKAEIVDVVAPSGFVFKFEKLSAVEMLFSGEFEDVISLDRLSGDEKIKKMLYFKDKTLQLSHSPKLVVGKADASKDELSTADVSPIDLNYLFQWVCASGNLSGEVKGG